MDTYLMQRIHATGLKTLCGFVGKSSQPMRLSLMSTEFVSRHNKAAKSDRS